MSKYSGLQNYVIIFRQNAPGIPPAFQCEAKDKKHAISQFKNTYENCRILHICECEIGAGTSQAYAELFSK